MSLNFTALPVAVEFSRSTASLVSAAKTIEQIIFKKKTFKDEEFLQRSTLLRWLDGKIMSLFAHFAYDSEQSLSKTNLKTNFFYRDKKT